MLSRLASALKDLRRSTALNNLGGYIEKVTPNRDQDKCGVEDHQSADYRMHGEPSPPSEAEFAIMNRPVTGRGQNLDL
jgi:hypothetical protein